MPESFRPTREIHDPEAVQAAEAYLDAPMFRLASDGHLVTDRSGRILAANGAAANLDGNGPLNCLLLRECVASEERAGLDAFLDRLTGAPVEGDVAQLRCRLRSRAEPVVLTAWAISESVAPLHGIHWMVQPSAPERGEHVSDALMASMQAELLESAPIAVAVVSGPDHRYVFANRAFREGLGGDDVEVVGRTVGDLFPELVERHGLDPFDRVYESGETVHLQELELDLGPHRPVTYWQVELVPLRDGAGHVGGVLILANEVTEEVEARHALEALAARDEAILSSLSEGLVISDADGTILHMNPAALRLHGFERLEEAQRHWKAFADTFAVYDMNGERLPPEAWPLGRVLAEGAIEAYRVRVERTDTGDVWFGSYSGTSLRDAAGAPTAVVLTIRDVTAEVSAAREQAQLLAAHRDHRHFMERLLAAAPVGVAAVRLPSYRYEYVNPFYAAIPGLAEQKILGRQMDEVLTEEVSRDAMRAMAEARAAGEPVVWEEYAAVVAQGLPTTYWDVTFVPLTSATGEVDRVLIVVQEATQQVHAREDAELMANEARRRADELHTVLLAITDPVVAYDGEGMPVMANPAAARAYGFNPVGATAAELCRRLEVRDADGSRVAPEDLPAMQAVHGRLVLDERYRFTNAEGEVRSIRVSAASLWEDEQIVGAVSVWHDITEQDALIEALEQERALLDALIDHAPEGIVLADAEARVLRTNPAADRLYRRPVPYGEDIDSHAEMGIMRPDGTPYPPREMPLERAALDGETVTDEELGIVWPDGQRRDLLVNTAPIRSPEGEVIGAVAVFQDITERNELMRQLETERARLRAILDALPIAVSLADADGKIVEMNGLVAQIWGGEPPVPYVQGYGAYRGWWAESGEPLAPEDWALARALHDGETSFGEEIDILRFDGTRGTILNAAAPVRDAEGEVIGAVAVSQDITEMRQLQAALERYATRAQALRAMDRQILAATSAKAMAAATLPQIRRLLGALHLSVRLLDPEHGELEMLASDTEAAEDLAVAARETFSPNVWEQLRSGPRVVPDLTAVEQTPLQRALYRAGVRSYTAVPLATHRDVIGVLEIGLGRPGSLDVEQLNIARDVANQLSIGIHQAQLHHEVQMHAAELAQRVADRTAELQASEARFRALFEEAAMGIGVTTLEGRFVQTNAALQQMLGYSEEELVDRAFDDVTHPDDVSVESEKFALLAQGVVDDYRVNKRLLHKDGSIIWARVTASLVRGGDGEPRFAMGMVEDVTAQREAQEALVQAEKLALTGQLAAAFTHEISNPLQSVLGALSLLEQDLPAEHSGHQFLSLATGELQRMARIVGEFRNLNRKSDASDREPTDVVALVEHALQLSARQAAKQDVEIRWMPPERPLPELHLARDRIHQVLLNLILNAIDAMPEGGELRVAAAADAASDEVVLSFTDTGVGIPEEVQPDLFEPFYTTKDDGMGMGLYVCHNIVAEHGGRIEVESTVGEGTTFTICLPLPGDGG